MNDGRTYLVGAFRQRFGPHHQHFPVDDWRRQTLQHRVALYELYSRSGDAERRGDRRPLGAELTGNLLQHELGHWLVGRHVVDGHLAQRLRGQQIRVLHVHTTPISLRGILTWNETQKQFYGGGRKRGSDITSPADMHGGHRETTGTLVPGIHGARTHGVKCR